MTMKRYLPQMVFTDRELGKNKDPHFYYRTIYTCPICKNKVSFNENDFLRYSQNKSIKLEGDFRNASTRNSLSYLEFECPGCHRQTVVFFFVSYGDKYPVIIIDSILVRV